MLTYTPSEQDIIDGTVTLTLSTNGSVAPCLPASSSVIIPINPSPVSTVTGTDGPVCPGDVLVFNGPAGMSTYSWIVSGNFATTGLLNQQNLTVTAGAANANFTVQLTVTNAFNCSALVH